MARFGKRRRGFKKRRRGKSKRIKRYKIARGGIRM